jgi:hypothetical protein
MEPEISLPFSREHALVSIFSQMNPVHTSQSCVSKIYFSLISLFWKNIISLLDHVAVCVCLYVSLYPHIDFWTPKPIFMKLGTYITAPEPISTA